MVGNSGFDKNYGSCYYSLAHADGVAHGQGEDPIRLPIVRLSFSQVAGEVSGVCYVE